MSHLRLVGKAISLNKLKQHYEKEKLNSINIHHGNEEVPAIGCCENLCKKIKGNVIRPVSQKTAKTRRFLKYFLKTFFYFLLGLALTYLFFMILVYHLHLSIHIATVLCFFLGGFLGLGLAFSTRIRCITCLCVPQLFSKRGRQAAVAYAYILILTGPTANTLINIGKLAETLLCDQEKMRSVFNKLKRTVEEPFIEFMDAIEDIVRIVRDEVRSLVAGLHRIAHLLGYVADGIEDGFTWLSNVVNICNKRLGPPFDRCVRMFRVVMADCKASMGPTLSFQCSPGYLMELICYALRPLEYFCELADRVEDAVVEAMRKGAHNLMLRLKHVFYVNIEFSSKMHVTTNVSKTPNAIAKELSVDMHNKVDTLLVAMSWFHLIPFIFFLLLVFKVVWYWHNFMTKDRFDNHYINSFFRGIDLERAKMDQSTILPLRKREQALYVSITSTHLLPKEKFRILRTSVFLFLTTVKIAIHMGTDYCLYWLMARIYHYAASQPAIPPQAFGDGHMDVAGTGFMVPLFKRLAKLLSSVHFLDDKTNQTVCMAIPSNPDYDLYIHIGILLAFCWLSLLVEPYVLRCRNHVMSRHHPQRARERAHWLFREIMRHRENIYTSTRRELRKLAVRDRRPYDHLTLGEYLGSFCSCACVRNLLGMTQKLGCWLCGVTGNDMIKCPSKSCRGVYCKSCWSDLGGICSVCKSPAEYGDSSDISEEMDSSDEEYIKTVTRSAASDEGENDDATSKPETIRDPF